MKWWGYFLEGVKVLNRSPLGYYSREYPISLGQKITGHLLLFTSATSLIVSVVLLVVSAIVSVAHQIEGRLDSDELLRLYLVFFVLTIFVVGSKAMAYLAQLLIGDSRMTEKDGFLGFMAIKLLWDVSCIMTALFLMATFFPVVNGTLTLQTPSLIMSVVFLALDVILAVGACQMRRSRKIAS